MRDFNHTVDVLVKAYLNNTLQHASCGACAVGNMVEESCRSIGVIAQHDTVNGWGSVFVTDRSADNDHRIHPEKYLDFSQAKLEIDSTGYTWQELSKIEYAFETCKYSDNEDEFMFNGLMDVIDVLAEIHGIDLTEKEEAKKLFVKA